MIGIQQLHDFGLSYSPTHQCFLRNLHWCKLHAQCPLSNPTYLKDLLRPNTKKKKNIGGILTNMYSRFLASILKSILPCAIDAFEKEACDSPATLVKYILCIKCIETSSDYLSLRAGISQLHHLGNLSKSSLEPCPKYVPLL